MSLDATSIDSGSPNYGGGGGAAPAVFSRQLDKQNLLAIFRKWSCNHRFLNRDCTELIEKLLLGIDKEQKAGIELVLKDGMELENLSPRLKNNKPLVRIAVSQNPRALEFAALDLKEDRDIALAALKKDKNLFLNAVGPNLRENKEFILEVIEIDFVLLMNASERMKDNEEVVLAAIEKKCSCINVC